MKTINLLLSLSIMLVLLNSCEDDKNCIYGSGSMVTANYEVSNINELAMYGEAEVFIKEDNQTSLRIEAQENVIDALHVELNGGELSIGRDNCFKDSEPLKVFLSTPDLSGVRISGLCDVSTEGTFKGAEFNAEIDGSGEMGLNIDVDEFNVLISGDGDIGAMGYADHQNIRISGAGEVKCFDLEGETGDIDIEGMGTIEINVSETLNINIAGTGDIYYLGTPEITKNISGIGNIVNAN